MGKASGWLVALGLALAGASGASAATLSPTLALPLSTDTLPPVSAPPSASLQLSGSGDTSIWNQSPEPATLMLLATGLGGLVILGHREFA